MSIIIQTYLCSWIPVPHGDLDIRCRMDKWTHAAVFPVSKSQKSSSLTNWNLSDLKLITGATVEILLSNIFRRSSSTLAFSPWSSSFKRATVFLSTSVSLSLCWSFSSAFAVATSSSRFKFDTLSLSDSRFALKTSSSLSFSIIFSAQACRIVLQLSALLSTVSFTWLKQLSMPKPMPKLAKLWVLFPTIFLLKSIKGERFFPN